MAPEFKSFSGRRRLNSSQARAAGSAENPTQQSADIARSADIESSEREVSISFSLIEISSAFHSPLLKSLSKPK